MGYEKPWSVDEAPERYIELLKKNIIGVEVLITRLEGKWKMSQELREGDREGVVEGFRKLGIRGRRDNGEDGGGAWKRR